MVYSKQKSVDDDCRPGLYFSVGIFLVRFGLVRFGLDWFGLDDGRGRNWLANRRRPCLERRARSKREAADWLCAAWPTAIRSWHRAQQQQQRQ